MIRGMLLLPLQARLAFNHRMGGSADLARNSGGGSGPIGDGAIGRSPLLALWMAIAVTALAVGCGGGSSAPNLSPDTGSQADGDSASGDPDTDTSSSADSVDDTLDTDDADSSEPVDGSDGAIHADAADGAIDAADVNDDGQVLDVDAGDSADTDDSDVVAPPTPCDDGIPCTIGEHILPNGGCGGGKFICGDCAGAPCATNADCKEYEDDNPCNGRLRCATDRCVLDVATIVSCSGAASSPETVRRCNPNTGNCQDMPLPPGAKCNDGDACTGRDHIEGGVCIGVDICSPCDGLGNGDPCDDGDSCTTDTTCSSGRCLGTFTCDCAVNADCASFDDGNLCNGTFRCVNNGCELSAATKIQCNRACPQASCFSGVCLEAKGQCTGKEKALCQD